MCVCELVWSSLPQFVQRYVPAETSLPAGTGFAMIAPLLWVRYFDFVRVFDLVVFF
jgi:hypothetical protein